MGTDTPKCPHSRFYGKPGQGPCRFLWMNPGEKSFRKYCIAELGNIVPIDELLGCKLAGVKLKFRNGVRDGVRDGTRAK